MRHAFVRLALPLLALAGCRIDQGISDDKGDDTAPPTYDPHTADTDLDGTVDADDCEPYDPHISPDAAELCDGIDNDCDGKVDEGFDEDDDGYKDVRDCYLLPGEWDCDDDDERINPDADEVCDGVDNDCDGVTDDEDDDADGFDSCVDCDDHDPFIYPGAPEACDDEDNDCDGRVDEGWDHDGDGLAACQGDCDDDDPLVSPVAAELCDGEDNDCDGEVDEGFDVDGDGISTCDGDCDDTRATVYPGHAELCDGLDNDCDASTREDVDGDGDGYTVCSGDCDDSAADASPLGTETCDGLDNDCNGHADDRMECFNCSEIGTYILCTTAASWYAAEDACEGFGGTLAVVDNSTENNQLVGYSATPTWIGATDQVAEGNWTTPDLSTPLPYSRWEAGEPDDAAGDCAVLNPGGHQYYWADSSCNASYRFLCEY